MSFYGECDGSYECEADGHEPGCLSHTIDPPSEIEVAARYPAHEQPSRPLGELLRRGAARLYRDGDE